VAENAISRQLAWQRRQVALGRCRVCGGERDSGGTTICAPCRIERRAKARLREGTRPWEPGRPGRPPTESRLVDPQHVTSLSYAAWLARVTPPKTERKPA